MREIKFRAWDAERKRMAYQDKANFSVRLRTPVAGNEIYINRGNFIDNIFVPEMGALMQYTGLKDKNGKEIYEGDIFQSPRTKLHYVVEWIDEDAKFSGQCVNNKPFCFEPYSWDEAEIVGNIYENPELCTKP